MKIAVIGGGGREHALIKRLKESARCGEIFAIPGNGGIGDDARCIDIKATDVAAITQFCEIEGVAYAVVAQDDPLAMGLVDLLAQKGIAAFGPTKAAARIEASKSFAKELMRKNNIPTAFYTVFEDFDKALEHVLQRKRYPVVVKADGLALGKGVAICANETEAAAALAEMLVEKRFGASGKRVVIEEYLTGPEVSVLCFCDGETLKPMVSSMDHKRAYDGDEGPNTGGMGVIAPNPFYTEEIAARCMEEIFIPTVRAMQMEGAPFRGCLYFGLMLTPDGPKVIEYNCRFGDPETQAVLPLLRGDLLEIMLACTEGRLAQTPVEPEPGCCACVVLASGGYPGHYRTGVEIRNTGDAASEHVSVYFAGTARRDGRLVTAGGRILGVSARADTLEQALQRAYAAMGKIDVEGSFYRRDIGQKALDVK